MPKYNLPNIHTEILKKRFLSISKAAKLLQVSPDTLRNWERQGKLIPARTPGGARRYSSFELSALKKEIQPFLIKHKGLLSISQAAKELGVSTDTLRNWTKRRLIDSQRTKGGARRFTRSEIKRVQDELGIEPKPVIQIPEQSTNFQPAIHRFSIPWKIISSSTLIGLILIIAFLLKQNIDSYNDKVMEVSGLVGKLAKSIESLQSGVYGIQTEMIPSPSPTSLPSQAVTYIQTTPSLIQSASSPIFLDKGVIGCKDCLTSSLNYLSGLENSDGSLNVSTVDKVVKLSLETNHTNNWSVNQAFGGGAIFNGGNVGIGTTTPIEGKLVVQDNGSSNLPLIYLSTEQTASSSAVLSITSDTANGSGAGTVKFRVTADGSVYSDSSIYSTPADLAEMYSVYGDAEEGDLVELVSNSKLGFAVQKATNDSGKKLLGIISTNPGSILGYNARLSGQKPVALAGRVPVKVSDENGPIEVGDYLTSSSIPGVAAKAKTRGVVIGQALESFEGSLTKSDDTNHLYYRRATIGKILSFMNVSFADPNNFFASLNFDDQGNLIVPKLKAGSIILDRSTASAASQLTISNEQLTINSDPNYTPSGPQLASGSNNYIDLSGEIASLEERVKTLENVIASEQSSRGNLKSDSSQALFTNDETEASSSATPSANLAEASSSAEIASSTTSPRNDVTDLNLTPPDILFATGSATLANIKVTDTLSSDKLFLAENSKISGELKVFGKTTIGDTIVAGHLTIDGTLSIENGNEINVIGNSSSSNTGILYLQKSSLAERLDILNGKVTIDKEGNLRAQSVTVADFKVLAGKISGSGKIASGTKSVEIENPKVKPSTRIIITPTSETNLVLAVTEKMEDKKFTVSAPQITDKDISFDWFMVNEEAEN